MEAESCKHQYVEPCDLGLCCLSCGAVRSSTFEVPLISPGTPHLSPDEEYQYSPLSRDLDEIRLIELYPGAETDPISCRIITVELRFCPPYLAMSYTWATEDGDVSKTQDAHIYVGKKTEKTTFKVTKNCENALRQIRRVDVYEMVWIDSICIDQNRVSERNHQVSIMGQLYSRALSVEMCIYAPSRDHRSAMELLAHSQAGVPYLESLPQADFDQDPCIVQLKALFRMRYFSRVWVIQEVLHARVTNLHVNADTVRFSAAGVIYLHKLCLAKSVFLPSLAQWSSIWQRSTGIIPLLSMSTKSSASDPRDIVFAITSVLYPETRAVITIDYMLSLEEVFAQAVMACIAECPDSEILSYAALPPGAHTLTTPSFTMTHFKEYLEKRSSTGVSTSSIQPNRLLRRYSPWSAKTLAELGRPVSFDKPIALCHSEACIRDCKYVATQHPPNATKQRHGGPLPPRQLLPHFKVRAQFVDLCTEPIDQKIMPLFAQVDAVYGSMDESKWSWLLDLFPSLHVSSDFDEVMSDRSRLQTFKSDLTEVIAKAAGWSTLDAFRTEHSMGLTSSSFMAGDAVFLIEGARHPLLLREACPNMYRIVGTCYHWAAADPDPERSMCFREAGRFGWRHPRTGLTEIF